MSEPVSGARVLSLRAPSSAGGDEKVFGVAVATPPTDSTGVAHILEHSVFCGSRSYPVKEPFALLLRGSLQTFLNAMTYPDRTVYPVASVNDKDFQNLVGVYLDAVLNPRLTDQTFQQEGWSYRPREGGDDTQAPLQYSGVVFNEMKGVYSSPDSNHGYNCLNALFPNHPYGVSSGGDPADIPDLDAAGLREFHQRWYRTGSNMRFYFWGDDDEDGRLARIDQALSDVGDAGVEAAPAALTADDVARQFPGATPQFTDDICSGLVPEFTAAFEPQVSVHGYPADANDQRVTADLMAGGPDPAEEVQDGIGATFVSVCWALADGGIPGAETAQPALPKVEQGALMLLSHLLLGRRTAPLHKALVDSGLGEDIVGSGFDSTLRQTIFETGLKGALTVNWKAVEELVVSTLERVATEGFSQDEILAELNTIDFQLRKLGAGGQPRGLHLFLAAAGDWCHGKDPLPSLEAADMLSELRQTVLSDPDYLPGLVRKHLLDNQHRVTVVTRPDIDMAALQTRAEQQRLQAACDELGEEGQQRAAADAEALRAAQSAEDPPEALATIPRLSVSDLGPKDRDVPYSVVAAHGDRPVIVHESPKCNGIASVTLALDTAAVGQVDLPLLPVLANVLTHLGCVDPATGHELSDAELSLQMGQSTGGISASHSITSRPVVSADEGSTSRAVAAGRRGFDAVSGLMLPVNGNQQPQLWHSSLALQGEALEAEDRGQLRRLAELMAGVATRPTFSRHDVLAAIQKESAAEMAASVATSGHLFAMSAASSALGGAARLNAALGGGSIQRLAFLKALSAELSQPGEAGERAAAALARRLGRVLQQCTSQAEPGSGYAVVACSPGAGDAVQSQCVDPLLEMVARGGGCEGDAESDVEADERLQRLLERCIGTGVAGTDAASYGFAASTALLQPMQVSYAAMASALPRPDDARGLPGSYEVAGQLMRTRWLWDEVRVRGGAYGAFCQINRASGRMAFASYRDPKISPTLDAFLKAPGTLRGLESEALSDAVIATVGGRDRPSTAAADAGVAATRWLLDLSAEQAQQSREEMIATSQHDLDRIADAMEASLQDASRAVVTSPEAAASAGLSTDNGWSLRQVAVDA